MALESEIMDDLLADSLQLECQLKQDNRHQLFNAEELENLAYQFQRLLQSLTGQSQFQLFCYSNLHLGQLNRYLNQHQKEDPHV
ncbi:hypothetical protein [Streptococcus sobrinus]|uniref:hypothetical protein n=1 Tax=Streptococcus sobrinus TaxID=1310 RepID=UPI000360BB32|nr:hypothetical protein [Streptococcus sobrinus]